MTVEMRIRPAPRPFSSMAIARRADEAAFVQGVNAGHADGVAHLRLLILEARVAFKTARRAAARFSQEDPARARYVALADLHRSYVRQLAQTARALRGEFR